jgi:hypothetical protein
LSPSFETNHVDLLRIVSRRKAIETRVARIPLHTDFYVTSNSLSMIEKVTLFFKKKMEPVF